MEINNQQQFIRAVFAGIDKDNGMRDSGTAEALAKSWELPSHLKAVLGAEGRVSIPVSIQNPEELILKSAAKYVEQLNDDLRKFFNASTVAEARTQGLISDESLLLFMKDAIENKTSMREVDEDPLEIFKKAARTGEFSALNPYDIKEMFFAVKNGRVVRPEAQWHQNCKALCVRLDYNAFRNCYVLRTGKKAFEENRRIGQMSVRKYIRYCAQKFFGPLYPELKDVPFFTRAFDTIEKSLVLLEQKVSVFQKEIEGRLYFSALPEDILTASINARGWGSCFGSGGSNWAAPYHYVGSGSFVIAFFIPESSKSKITHLGHKDVDVYSPYHSDSEDLSFYNKTWRKFFILTPEGNLSSIKSEYPFVSHELGKAAEQEMIKMTKAANPNLCEKDSPKWEDSSVRAAYYLEGSYLLLSNGKPGTTHLKGAPCDCCGLRSNPYYSESGTDSMICLVCEPDRGYCGCCDEAYPEDELTFVSDGNTYCEYCLSRQADVYYCEESGEYLCGTVGEDFIATGEGNYGIDSMVHASDSSVTIGVKGRDEREKLIIPSYLTNDLLRGNEGTLSGEAVVLEVTKFFIETPGYYPSLVFEDGDILEVYLREKVVHKFSLDW